MTPFGESIASLKKGPPAWQPSHRRRVSRTRIRLDRHVCAIAHRGHVTHNETQVFAADLDREDLIVRHRLTAPKRRSPAGMLT